MSTQWNARVRFKLSKHYKKVKGPYSVRYLRKIFEDYYAMDTLMELEIIKELDPNNRPFGYMRKYALLMKKLPTLEQYTEWRDELRKFPLWLLILEAYKEINKLSEEMRSSAVSSDEFLEGFGDKYWNVCELISSAELPEIPDSIHFDKTEVLFLKPPEKIKDRSLRRPWRMENALKKLRTVIDHYKVSDNKEELDYVDSLEDKISILSDVEFPSRQEKRSEDHT